MTDLSWLTDHDWRIMTDWSWLIYHDWLTMIDLPWLTDHDWPIMTDLSWLTYHDWPIMTDWSWLTDHISLAFCRRFCSKNKFTRETWSAVGKTLQTRLTIFIHRKTHLLLQKKTLFRRKDIMIIFLANLSKFSCIIINLKKTNIDYMLISMKQWRIEGENFPHPWTKHILINIFNIMH